MRANFTYIHNILPAMQRCIISNCQTTRNRSKAGLGRKDLQVNPRLWNGVDLL